MLFKYDMVISKYTWAVTSSSFKYYIAANVSVTTISCIHRNGKLNVNFVHVSTSRFSPALVPVGAMRESLEDVELEGFTIPKGTMVAPNLYEMHHNEDDWPQPHSFKPERWLTSDPQNPDKLVAIPTPDSFMPFGLGWHLKLPINDYNGTNYRVIS